MSWLAGASVALGMVAVAMHAPWWGTAIIAVSAYALWKWSKP